MFRLASLLGVWVKMCGFSSVCGAPGQARDYRLPTPASPDVILASRVPAWYVALMRHFIVTNYALGRKVDTHRIRADSPTAAVLAAEDLRLPAHGLPGNSPRAAPKSRVLGIREVAAPTSS